jgi:hypothetical protein
VIDSTFRVVKIKQVLIAHSNYKSAMAGIYGKDIKEN